MARTMDSPRPVPLAGAGRVAPVEAVEDPGRLRRRRGPGPRRAPAARPSPPARVTSTRTGVPGGVWVEGVAHQVVGDLAQAVAVARRPPPGRWPPARSAGRARPPGRRRPRRRPPGAGRPVRRSRGRPWSSRASRSRSSTRPPIRAASCSMRASARSPALLVGEGALAQELGVAADRGERRAQLVGGVGHELAQPGLGRRLLVEGRLDLGQHGVEGGAEPADLGALVLAADPAGEVPEAMAPAVSVMSSSGRSPRRTVHRARTHSAATTASDTSSSTRSSEARVCVGGVEGDGGDQGALGHGHRLGPVAGARARPAPSRRSRRGSGR